MDLTNWRKHIDRVVADEGQWLGILDENGLPLLELGGVISVTFPKARLTASSVEVEVSVQPGDRVLDELVGNGLGVQDSTGALVPANGPTRLLMMVRSDGQRRAATIIYTVVAGKSAPSTLTIHALDLLDGLAWWPCPSIPAEWKRAAFTEWRTDASGVTYVLPRELAQVRLATKADGYTMDGPAVSTVRNLIQDSLDAVNKLYGWDNQPHAVVAYDTQSDTSDRVLIRVNDDPVLDTVASACKVAGVGIDVSLWWPGDPPILCRNSVETVAAHSWAHPIQIIHVNKIEEV
ncbi:hypothetical protein [Corynebacterium sp. DNF00584]|uniref:hypothetical protein n=1 Tax=Corynebacterium sp. DNF00584 TaxID=1384076 RepID=UPI00079AF0AD|nr:hypothetical protein [Corynebacterium sp. DNF00584]KXB52723.1 hypothetical protein HMPREF0307_02041 [Corynebacterium sp. DNF00584]